MAISLDGSTGVNITSGGVIIPAGTSSVSPIALAAGTNRSTATAGSVEYNGKTLLFTPQGTQRGVVPGMQTYFLNSDFVGTTATTDQPIFGVGVTLSSSTVYRFRANFGMSKTVGTQSHTLALAFGGTATLNNIAYQPISNWRTIGFTGLSAPDNVAFIQTASSTVVTTAGATSSRQFMAVYEGTVSVNAGGTFIPSYTLSASPTGAYSTAAGSFFEIWPIGASGSNVSIGAWA
jgi:hypothetical protein